MMARFRMVTLMTVALMVGLISVCLGQAAPEGPAVEAGGGWDTSIDDATGDMIVTLRGSVTFGKNRKPKQGEELQLHGGVTWINRPPTVPPTGSGNVKPTPVTGGVGGISGSVRIPNPQNLESFRVEFRVVYKKLDKKGKVIQYLDTWKSGPVFIRLPEPPK